MRAIRLARAQHEEQFKFGLETFEAHRATPRCQAFARAAE